MRNPRSLTQPLARSFRDLVCKSISANLLVVVAFLFLVLPVSVPTCQVVQAQQNFREFEREKVHSPTELFADLYRLIGKNEAKRNPLAGLDPETIKRLNQASQDFFNKLSDDEKKKARDFAKNFLKDKRIDSAESIRLMDDLGISRETQEQMAKEFGEINGGSLDDVREMISRYTGEQQGTTKGKDGLNDGKGRTGRPEQGGASPNATPDNAKQRNSNGEFDPNRNLTEPKARPMTERPRDNNGGSKNSQGRNNNPNDRGFGSNPNQNPQETDSLKGEAKPGLPNDKVDRPANRTKNRLGGAQADRDRSESQTTGPVDDPFTQTPQQSNSKNRTGREPRTGEPELRRPERGNSKFGNPEPSRADIQQLAQNESVLKRLQEFKDQNPSLKNEIQGQIDTVEDNIRTIEDKIQKLRGSQTSDPTSQSQSPTAEDVFKDVSGTSGFDSPEMTMEEGFKSWVQKKAIEEKLNQWKASSDASELAAQSRKDAMSKAFKGLGKSFGETLGKGTNKKLSRGAFKKKLDRALFKAANDVESSLRNEGSDSESEGGAIDKTIDGLLDRVHNTVKKNQEKKKRERRADREQRAEEQLQNDTAGLSNSGGTSGGDRINFEPNDIPTPAGDLFGAMPSLPEVPSLSSLNPTKILLYLALFCFVIFMIYLLIRNFGFDDEETSAERRFGRSFQSAKIRSPKDLVDAVDYFIVRKFGAGSRWWNAGHAQEILCAGAPDYSGKISDLIKDYVRARYTHADASLSDVDQQKYKSMLQELSKEVQPEAVKPEAVVAASTVQDSESAKVQ